MRDAESLVGRTLASLDVSLDRARELVRREVGEGDAPATGSYAYTNEAQIVWSEAAVVLDDHLRSHSRTTAGHSKLLGPEHILLGLCRAPGARGHQLLAQLADVSSSSLHDQVYLRLLDVSDEIRNEAWADVDANGPAPEPEQDATDVPVTLRRVISVGKRLRDGGWLTSVEIFDTWFEFHGVGPAASAARRDRWAAAPWDDTWEPRSWRLGWVVEDDVGTAYELNGGGGGTGGTGHWAWREEFKPPPPSNAGVLRLRSVPSGDRIEIRLK